MTEENTAESVAREAGQAGKFNFLDRLLGRRMPTETVTIFLDEDAEYHAMHLRRELSNMTKDEDVSKVEAELTALEDRRDASAVRIKLTSLPTKVYDEIIDAVNEEYPLVVDETKNPLTGRVDRTPVAEPKRDTLFMKMQWARSIQSVELPDGSVAEDEVDLAWVSLFLQNAPLAAVTLIQETIGRLRMAVEWMDDLQGPDFSRRS